MEYPKSKPRDEVTLSSLVRDALERFEGNADPAGDYVYRSLIENQVLLKDIIYAAIRYAAYHKTQESVRQVRSEVVNLYETREARSDSVRAKARVISSTLFDFPLAGGGRVGGAARPQVLTQASRYRSQANTDGMRARWLYKIASLLPDDDKIVESVLTLQQLEQLWEESKTSNSGVA